MRMRNPKAPKRNERCIALGGYTRQKTRLRRLLTYTDYFFTNEYHAEGSASFNATKKLTDRSMKDGEFTFIRM